MNRDPVASPQKSGFLRNVLVIATGSAASQALALIALPVVTRLYSPEQFGVLAVFAGMVGILSVVSCLRIENAIPLSRSTAAATQVAVVALVVLIAISLLAFCIAHVAIDYLHQSLEGLSHLGFSILVALGVLGAGLYQIGSAWSVREGSFTLIGKTRFQQTIVGTVTQLGLGVWGVGVVGLIVGFLLSQVAGFFSLTKKFFQRLFRQRSSVFGSRRIAWIFIRYRRFPLFDAPAALLNSASSQIPAILFALWFSAELAGYFALSMRLLSAPIGLVGASVSQVLTKRLVEAHRQNDSRRIIAATFGMLVRFSFIPFGLFVALAPSVFPMVFGKEWIGAGEVAAWTGVWVCLQFVYAPLSIYFVCTEKQRINLFIQSLFFIFRFLPLIVLSSTGSEVNPVMVFSVSSVVCYLVALFILAFVSGLGVRTMTVGVFSELGFAAVFGFALFYFAGLGLFPLSLGVVVVVGFYIYRMKKSRHKFTAVLG